MATPNPLNDYNTYSYLHFLIVADSTEKALEVAEGDNFLNYALGRVNGDGHVAFFANPLSSNVYVIESLEWTSIIAAGASAGTSSFGSEGKFTLVEPNGVDFFNSIFEVYSSYGMAMNSDAAVWMIKTIFAGYTNVPQSGSVEYITNLKPLLININDIEAEFTEAGGRYDFKFVPMAGGAASKKSNNVPPLQSGGSINLAPKNTNSGTSTLVDAMKAVNEKIAANINIEYGKEVEIGAQKPEQVAYQIELAQEYQDASYTVLGTDVNSANATSGLLYAIRPGEGIDETLSNIMKMSPKVREDSEKRGILFRINSSMITTDPATNNGVRKVLRYVIYQYKTYSSKNAEESPSETVEKQTPQGTEVTIPEGAAPGQQENNQIKLQAIETTGYLEYDYVYTGKNLDILDFHMKMALGIAFFGRIKAAGNVAKKGQIPTNGAPVSANGLTPGGGNKPYTPPIPTNGAPLHSSNPQSTALYDQLLRDQNVVDTIAISMGIRGNPLLMSDMSLTSRDIDAIVSGQPATGQLLANWLTGDIIVKVNVMMPADDSGVQFKKFWYDGFWRVISITHKFEGGEFTQDLEMIALQSNSFPVQTNVGELRQKSARPDQEPTPEDDAIKPAENVGDRKDPKTLDLSDAGLKFIKKGEGWSSIAYPDQAGFLTIGYGHKLTDNEKASGEIKLASGEILYTSRGLTKEQGEKLLRQDAASAISSVRKYTSAPLYQREFDTLVSFTYNLGGGAYAKSTLRKVVNASNYSGVPAQLRRFINAGGKPSQGLINRRNDEIAQWGSA